MALEELILESDGGVRVVTTWVTFFEKNFSSLWFTMSVNLNMKNGIHLPLQVREDVASNVFEHLRAHSRNRIQSQETPFGNAFAIV